MAQYSCVVAEGLPPGLRLDRYIAEHLKILTRSQVKARTLTARLNGKAVKVSRILKSGDALELTWADPEPASLIPENLPLRILYEDSRVVVVDKDQGIVVHPGAGNRRGTLANALLFRRLRQGGLDAGEAFRPGIVHRLDKDTSGVIIAAYDDEALRFLAEQFKQRQVRKTYIAIVKGTPPESAGRIETLIARDPRDRKRFTVSADNGKIALTLYRVLRAWEDRALILLRPKTGRTHQLRVHLRHLGHPILGDPIYGASEGLSLMLHAKNLTVRLPEDPEPRTFTAPLPPRFWNLIKQPASRL
ncbi:MAG: RluA family pseudouridine synthase [Spirochaetaceae bacterium]|jgi:23S rRNA pseudouridine1911/1915/1917 synthase|nr:RluA family pseudouridine synthase [Spirochaetaceae bacterium]